MPDFAAIGTGGLSFAAFLIWIIYQQFSGAKGKNSAYPPRDEKHDANQGELREIKTMIEAGFRGVDRRFDKADEKLTDMHTLGEVIKDRTQRGN